MRVGVSLGSELGLVQLRLVVVEGQFRVSIGLGTEVGWASIAVETALNAGISHVGGFYRNRGRFPRMPSIKTAGDKNRCLIDY